MHDTRTRSPTARSCTAGPTSIDGADGLVAEDPARVTSGTSPLRMCRSVPQIVTASTRTIASRGVLIVGIGTSSQALLSGPVVHECLHDCRPSFVGGVVDIPLPTAAVGFGMTVDGCAAAVSLVTNEPSSAMVDISGAEKTTVRVVRPAEDLQQVAGHFRQGTWLLLRRQSWRRVTSPADRRSAVSGTRQDRAQQPNQCPCAHTIRRPCAAPDILRYQRISGPRGSRISP